MSCFIKVKKIYSYLVGYLMLKPNLLTVAVLSSTSNLHKAILLLSKEISQMQGKKTQNFPYRLLLILIDMHLKL